MPLIKDLIQIPEAVHKGDFVLKLTEGVNKPEQTVKDYVVTDQLQRCFDDALKFIRSAVDSNTSKAGYLHGSFGSGKSHFMAILHLILHRDSAVGRLTKLASVIDGASEWTHGKRFLLVPYHMIGAKNMEAGILGGYADFIRAKHPDAPVPAIYLVDDLLRDAARLRQSMGDPAFFDGLNAAGGDSDWGELEGAWDADRFEAAMAAPPIPESDPNYAPSEPRRELASALIKTYFQSYENVRRSEREAYVSLDAGLSIISQHAKALKYDAVILFLDELILWLASHAADLEFMHQEGQKLAKLVEAQHADRPIPLVSFVARQRDLGELVGENITGADRLNFSDALRHWEGRFHKITLEDRNLPAIAEARILKPTSDSAREELDLAFNQTARIRQEVMNALLTSKYNRDIFRQVYPFSPALVDTLVGVSSLLQRERTALKVMMLLLVSQRETLKLGDIVPVGDLFDVIAHGDEAFNQDMAIQFENAKRLYHQKLLPLLESRHGVRKEQVDQLPYEDPQAVAFRADDRLVKTLLLAALVPGVESLKGLNANRLAALNHGSIKVPVAGKEGAEVLKRCREWAAEVGEVKIGDEHANPSISVQLSGVDTERIIEQARHEDSQGNRQRLIRRMLFEEMGIADADEFFLTHPFTWRNTERWCEIGFGNIRSLPLSSLEAGGEEWKLLIDFPFDEPGHSPHDDQAKLEEYERMHPSGTRTLAWIPSFLTTSAQNELGMLVILDHILAGERFDGYASILPFEDRPIAKALLENQRSQLRQRVRQHLQAAYGIDRQSKGSVDTSHELHEHFRSLLPDFDPQPPAAANLAEALNKLLEQAMQRQFPAHPKFEAEPKGANLRKVCEEVLRATQARDGRIEVDDRSRRPLLRDIAQPLLLGDMHETVFLLGQHWKNHFNPRIIEAGGTPTVGQLRVWLDEPSPMGLPKEVQNVVILVYAQQTNRTFYEHGAPVKADVSLAKLPDHLELRTWVGPPEKDWTRAVELAGSVFGLAPSKLLNATNVSRLSSDVKQLATEHQPACSHLCTVLTDRLDKFGLDREAAARRKTAIAVSSLLDRILSADDKDVIQTLSGARVETSDTAMGKSLKTAAELIDRIDATSWPVFEDIAELAGGHTQDATEIREQVSEALQADEYHVPLASTLKQAQAAAVRLLASVAKSKTKEMAAGSGQTPAGGGQSTVEGSPSLPPLDTQAGPGGGPAAARRLITQGVKERLTAEQTRELWNEIEDAMNNGAARRLTIHWRIEE
jgi:hypothetical protein